MRYLLFILPALLLFFSARSTAQGKTFFPEESFDSREASIALEKGNATIEGVVYAKRKDMSPIARGSKAYGAGATITLYPVTPYFTKWYKLRKKKETKKNRVYMSEEAAKYCIVVKADENGHFRFDQLKPGEYFLQTFVGYYSSGSADHYVGSSYGEDNYGGFTINHYERENYLISNTERIEEFITIEPGETLVKIKLNKKAPVGGVLE